MLTSGLDAVQSVLMKYKTEPSLDHKSLPNARIGVLLVNLGTPSALDYFSMRRYLKQFLEDPRVVEMNRFLWKSILNGVLLNFIPQRSARNYTKIWDQEKDESPLLQITRSQAEKLQEAYGDDVIIDFAMRYGQPSIESKIEKMKEQGVTKLAIFPLYPQYSAVTTASVMDDVFDTLKKTRTIPTIRMADPYYDDPAYIDALAKSMSDKLDDDTLLITSYHGLPKRYFTNGDPYSCHCYKTTRLLKEKLNLSDDQVMVTFQSRFGKEEWLKPYFDHTLEELPSQGKKKIAVMTPGFASDCVETLEEVAIGGKEAFLEAGGESFDFIPCLNDSQNSINMLKTLTDNALKGWK